MKTYRSMRGDALAIKAIERSPEEKALVRRLDIFLMTFGCISQVIKYLDQQNINNAYVSGMKEDLSLYGNELNYFTTYFNISYALMLIPSQVIMTYVRPSYWLPGLEILWGLITGLIAMATSAKQVYILRVFLGLCESSAWPGMMTLFTHWYMPSELAKRMAFYHSCQSVGSMLSGGLQGAISSSLGGALGLAAWRWLFIINAIITVVWGFFGFVMIPDLPNKPNPLAFWFDKSHATTAMARLKRFNRAKPKKITWAGARRTFRLWPTYFISILYIASVLGTSGYSYFGLFLKSLKNADGTARWSTTDVNVIPIGGGAITVIFVWIWAFASDFFETRWTIIVIQALIGITADGIMSVWTSHWTTTPLSAAYAGYFISYICLGTAPLIIAWLSDLLPQDPEARTLIVGFTIAGYYAMGAWSQVLMWPAKEAPHYKTGWQAALACLILVIVMTAILRFIDVKYLQPKRDAFVAQLEEAADEERAGTSTEGVESTRGDFEPLNSKSVKPVVAEV